jgi:hypothetical protein
VNSADWCRSRAGRDGSTRVLTSSDSRETPGSGRRAAKWSESRAYAGISGSVRPERWFGATDRHLPEWRPDLMAVSRADCARSATRVVSVHMTAGFLLVVRGPTGAWSQHAGHLARPLVYLGGERCFTTMSVAGCFWLEAARSLGIRPFLLGPCRTAAHRGYHLPRRSNPLRTTYAPTAPCPGKRGQPVNLTGVFAHMLSSDSAAQFPSTG